jgi:hypothetical protein
MCLESKVVCVVIGDEITHVGVLLAVEFDNVEVFTKKTLNVFLGIAIDEIVVRICMRLVTSSIAILLESFIAV